MRVTYFSRISIILVYILPVVSSVAEVAVYVYWFIVRLFLIISSSCTFFVDFSRNKKYLLFAKVTFTFLPE